MTIMECSLVQCAHMILNDQCPPSRKFYLCIEQEDDSIRDCHQCWTNFIWKMQIGEIPACFNRKEEDF